MWPFTAAIPPGVIPLPRPATPAERNVRKGVLIMISGIALFSILNGVVKDQVQVFPVNQVVFFRNALALPALLAIIDLTGGLRHLQTRHFRRHATHAVTMTLSIMAAFVGFRLMPLAEATAIGFLCPLLVAALAAPLLGERVRPVSWIATALGFAGVLVMTQPGAGGWNAGVFYSLAAALVGALNMLQQRRLSLLGGTLGITFWYMAISSALLAPTLFVSWVTPTGPQLAGLVAMGLTSGVCQYVTLRPMYYAGAATLAPVQYTSII